MIVGFRALSPMRIRGTRQAWNCRLPVPPCMPVVTVRCGTRCVRRGTGLLASYVERANGGRLTRSAMNGQDAEVQKQD
jgi:hypothetical protein